MGKSVIPDYQIAKLVTGSTAYGTAVPGSDIDYKGIYAQHPDRLLGFGYREQTEHDKDWIHYEIRRFLQLAQSANPTMLELLYTPFMCIKHSTDQYNLLRDNRKMFLTKECAKSFGGYAIAQIKKAKGLDKKMNWEKSRVQRKTPLDFCFVYEDGKTMRVEDFLFESHMKQESVGLVALDHFRDCYAMYYDFSDRNGFPPKGFHGISMDESNSVRLSSVPKDLVAVAIMFYNKDGYSQHCKDYREYQEWLSTRNTQRFVDTTQHGQKIDGKNMMHCRRLLDMAFEIALEKTIRVERPDAARLLKIRHGQVPLEALIEQAEMDIQRLDDAFRDSGLPDSVDPAQVDELLLTIRKSIQW